MGEGKLAEIAAYVEENEVDFVIFDDELSPSQIRNLDKVFSRKIYDRTSLILEIFAQRATTAYAKTQVELAQCQYLLPRLTGMWTHLERQRGGTGTRGGAGEREIETDRRIVRDRISRLKEQLKKIDKQMAVQRSNRGQLVRVALVGYTNVGKSTILSVVTSAKPKIGNYHFTTLTPNLGIVRRHGKDIVLADIPGLIEGAADGAGLGHDFLRHVERTRLLLHVLDIAGSEGRDPVEDFDQINHELANYGELAERPQIVVCNKSDLPDSEENVARLKAHLAELGLDYPVFVVSAATHQGFDALLDKTGDMLEALPPIVHFEEEVSYDDSVKPGTFEVVRDGAVFEVVGSSMQRLIDSVNFDDEESMSWFHRTLRKWGVIDALRKAGAQEGDTVRIIDMEFDFVE